MLKNIVSIFLIVFGLSAPSFGQIERVIVETYYIVDSNDVAFDQARKLSKDSKTYRVYVDLVKGSSLLRIYGDNNHTLRIFSSEIFYNQVEDGVSLGYELSRNRMKEGTVAIDSWLIIGQIAKSGTDVQYGVLKTQDQNGASTSIGIGANIDYLLKNNIPSLGIPLTLADGLMPHPQKPTNWLSQGFVNPLTGEEETVFGNRIVGNRFESNAAFIRNSGTTGVIADSNQVLIAQLTTAGDLNFALNLEVMTADGKTVKYVADATTLLNDEQFSPWLNYPPTCGCLDPNYVEYSAGFACNDASKCKTPIVYGCMDPLACNFNSQANFNIETLCCYIGYCNDNDLEVICPNLPPRNGEESYEATIYPNPVLSELNVTHNLPYDNNSTIQIFSVLGELMLVQSLDQNLLSVSNVSLLPQGNYVLKISNNHQSLIKKFTKLN